MDTDSIAADLSDVPIGNTKLLTIIANSLSADVKSGWKANIVKKLEERFRIAREPDFVNHRKGRNDLNPRNTASANDLFIELKSHICMSRPLNLKVAYNTKC